MTGAVSLLTNQCNSPIAIFLDLKPFSSCTLQHSKCRGCTDGR
jgi:hypothetical protein